MRKPITREEYRKVYRLALDGLNLASSHDPEHTKELKGITRNIKYLFKWSDDVDSHLQIIDRQLERLGAPQYRVIRKGPPKILAERVRKQKQ